MGQEIALLENPGQYGEGRNRQGRSHEQNPGHGVVAGEQLGLPGLESQGQQHAQGQGHAHPHGRDPTGQRETALQQLGIELEPNQKHEQHQPQLTQQVQLAAHGRGKQVLFQAWYDGAKHAGAEGDAAHNLANHPRLVEPLSQLAQELGHHDDQGDRHHGGWQRCPLRGDCGKGCHQGPQLVTPSIRSSISW